MQCSAGLKSSCAALSKDSDWNADVQEDDVDPLDAFMDAAVNPEVAAAEKAEAARKEALRTEQVKALAVRPRGQIKQVAQLHHILSGCAKKEPLCCFQLRVAQARQVLCMHCSQPFQDGWKSIIG